MRKLFDDGSYIDINLINNEVIIKKKKKISEKQITSSTTKININDFLNILKEIKVL